MPYITSAERIGIEIGIERGIERGIAKGLREGIILGLEARWGDLSMELTQAMERLDEAALRQLARDSNRMADVPALSEWLQLHSPE